MPRTECRVFDVRRILAGFLLALPVMAARGQANPIQAREIRIGESVRVHALDTAFSRAVVVATNSARLKNQAVVESGDVVVNDAASGDTLQTGYELSVDPRASTAAGSDLKAGRLRIKNNAVVAGGVFFNTLLNQGTILGARTTPLPFPSSRACRRSMPRCLPLEGSTWRSRPAASSSSPTATTEPSASARVER
jgi:hypothetical protein